MPNGSGTARSFLGVFVPALYLQSEGIERVLDSLAELGANAVCYEPILGRPGGGRNSVRYPDLHADGFERLLDRPLWSRRELLVQTYDGIEGAVPPDLPGADCLERAVGEARARGLSTHMMLSPLAAGGRDATLRPRRLDAVGRPWPEVAVLACPSSPAARRLAVANVQATLRRFAALDGLVLDWTEYPAYALHDAFACICHDCRTMAADLGLPWDSIIDDLNSTWQRLSELVPRDLRLARRIAGSAAEAISLLSHRPGWFALLRLKAASVASLHAIIRDTLDDAGGRAMSLTSRGWAPPWNLISGMDYRDVSRHCDVVAPKLFTFDFAAMPRWYGRVLTSLNPTLADADVLDALVEIMDLPDDRNPRRFADYQIPGPRRRHPIQPASLVVRVERVVDEVSGASRVRPIVHPGVPAAQLKEIIAAMRDTTSDGIWVNHYGYLSDRKLRILAEMWRPGS